MKLFRRIKYFFILLIISIFCVNCAKIIPPSGGPQDITPPKILESNPPNKTVNFAEKKITMRFDEYVQINKLPEYFNISPPLKKKPDFKIKGKSLAINFNDTLQSAITYTMSFGDGIADLNENNPLKNFQFIFSTGPNLDSMSVTGSVFDAFTLQPVEGGLVMLHANQSDSAPTKKTPTYVEKLDKSGNFSLNNLKNGTYKIFALKDANNNMKYDLANEKFGFLDSSIRIGIKISEVPDTLKDINKKDSIVLRKIATRFPKNIKILMFEKENKTQYMTNSDRPEPVKCVFTFSKSLDKNLIIRPLNFKMKDNWNYLEKNKKNDTIICWIKDTIVGNKDSLKLELKYTKISAKGKAESFTDTIIMKTKPKAEIKGKIKQKPKLFMKINVSNNTLLDKNVPICFEFGHPLLAYDTTLIKLYTIMDSVATPVSYIFNADSAAKKLITAYPRKYTLNKTWDEGKTYKLKLLPCAFSDIYDLSNDTITYIFKIQKLEYYGTLALKMKNVKSPIIVQWMDTKETILRQDFISSDKLIKYDYQKPMKYKLKVIYDNNNNGKWDAGEYSKKLQPEKVLYLNSEILIRSNWDIEQEWKID